MSKPRNFLSGVFWALTYVFNFFNFFNFLNFLELSTCETQIFISYFSLLLNFSLHTFQLKHSARPCVFLVVIHVMGVWNIKAVGHKVFPREGFALKSQWIVVDAVELVDAIVF